MKDKDIPKQERLRQIEIYTSVQGESTWAGLPCVFIRLAGCHLRCTWCDSEFTFTGGTYRSITSVVEEVAGMGIDLVEVTGGEPLLQKQCIPLMQQLLDRGHRVLIETSGSLDVSDVPEGVHIIMDLKPPDSGELDANRMENIGHLKPGDEIKFVLASRRDYEWSRELVRMHSLDTRFTVLFSTAYDLLDPARVSDWLCEDKLAVRLQLQMHKYIWPPNMRGV